MGHIRQFNVDPVDGAIIKAVKCRIQPCSNIDHGSITFIFEERPVARVKLIGSDSLLNLLILSDFFFRLDT